MTRDDERERETVDRERHRIKINTNVPDLLNREEK